MRLRILGFGFAVVCALQLIVPLHAAAQIRAGVGLADPWAMAANHYDPGAAAFAAWDLRLSRLLAVRLSADAAWLRGSTPEFGTPRDLYSMGAGADLVLRRPGDFRPYATLGGGVYRLELEGPESGVFASAIRAGVGAEWSWGRWIPFVEYRWKLHLSEFPHGDAELVGIEGVRIGVGVECLPWRRACR